ncbi:hypothetical protein IMZ31_23245 (plasmid) [Pontibacillus sp. ALD_SL1]|uniref:hypothetical protein n=1 Tax=Pontibacillus sp. ALD_SL1 TaxID=2777185 RepID=UPI001A966DCE|nr:hypothetical protein [Pontibacillus sp. ALD_SL1]QST02369.1 hypothetical protein IMZ31_23245 [Pontibacillus sp. ALD_SL1]
MLKQKMWKWYEEKRRAVVPYILVLAVLSIIGGYFYPEYKDKIKWSKDRSVNEVEYGLGIDDTIDPIPSNGQSGPSVIGQSMKADVIASPNKGPYSESTGISFSASITGSGTPPYTVSWSNYPNGSSDIGKFGGIEQYPIGSHTVTATIKDSKGKISKSNHTFTVLPSLSFSIDSLDSGDNTISPPYFINDEIFIKANINKLPGKSYTCEWVINGNTTSAPCDDKISIKTNQPKTVNTKVNVCNNEGECKTKSKSFFMEHPPIKVNLTQYPDKPNIYRGEQVKFKVDAVGGSGNYIIKWSEYGGADKNNVWGPFSQFSMGTNKISAQVCDATQGNVPCGVETLLLQVINRPPSKPSLSMSASLENVIRKNGDDFTSENNDNIAYWNFDIASPSMQEIHTIEFKTPRYADDYITSGYLYGYKSDGSRHLLKTFNSSDYTSNEQIYYKTSIKGREFVRVRFESTLYDQHPSAQGSPDDSYYKITFDETLHTTSDLSFEATGSIDPDGDSIYYEWKTDQGDWTQKRPAQPFTPGEHTVYVRAVDVYGGVSEFDSTRFTIGNRPPEKPSLTMTPSGDRGELYNSDIDFINEGRQSANWNFDASAPDDSEITRVIFNTADFKDNYFQRGGLYGYTKDGTVHPIKIYGYEGAGRVFQDISVEGREFVRVRFESVMYDADGDRRAYGSGDQSFYKIYYGKAIYEGDPIEFFPSGGSDPDGDNISFQYKFDGGDWQSQTRSNFDIGVHTVRLRSVDEWGAASPETEITFEVLRKQISVTNSYTIGFQRNKSYSLTHILPKGYSTSDISYITAEIQAGGDMNHNTEYIEWNVSGVQQTNIHTTEQDDRFTYVGKFDITSESKKSDNSYVRFYFLPSTGMHDLWDEGAFKGYAGMVKLKVTTTLE